MFTIPRSSYEEFRRVDDQAQLDLAQRGKKDGRRLGQRFYDYFNLHKLTQREDCILADLIYTADTDVNNLIKRVIDEGN